MADDEEKENIDKDNDVTEEYEQNKNVFAVDKLDDIISPARKNLQYHWNDYNPKDMLRYLSSKISMIRKHLPDTYLEIKNRLKDQKTTLFTDNINMEPEIFFEWWELIEGSGEETDQHGFYKARGEGFHDMILDERPPVYDYGVIYGMSDLLFEKGHVNVCIGSMDSGKSNYMLGVGLLSIQLGYYKLTGNLGIKEGYEHPWLSRCVWMTELLRLISHNKIENIKHEQAGKPLKKMFINCILDEGEAIMQATSRGDDKQAGEFSKFINFCRKSDTAMSFIYHDLNNFPKSLRKSSNVSAIIHKGMDTEGKELNEPQKEAIIEFPAKGTSIHISNIPPCDLLDTDEWSSFDIIDDDQSDKSVNMNEIFKIVKNKGASQVPHAILRYLDDLSFENQPYETVLDMVKRIHTRIADNYLEQCEKSKMYETILRREMELTYKIADADKIKYSSKAIKKVAQEEFDLFLMNKKKDEVDPETIGYKDCDYDLLVKFATHTKPGRMKDLIGEDYRKIDRQEIIKLMDRGVSRNKIAYIYSWKIRNIDIFKNVEPTLLENEN